MFFPIKRLEFENLKSLYMMKKMEQLYKAMHHISKDTRSHAHQKFLHEHFEICKLLIDENPYTLNQARFLQLHKSDLLERQISPNIEFWLSSNFSYLTKYSHKK
jgi:hypothetical protein